MKDRTLARFATAAHAVLLVAMLVGTGTALAGAGTVATAVTPLSDTVTYSKGSPLPLDTLVGYQVAIGNAGGNTINNIRFTATASVTNSLESVQFLSSEGATCDPVGGTTIECSIGQLSAGQNFPAFALFFKAPTSGSEVLLSGVTFYAEGTGGLGTSVPQNSTTNWVALAVTLGTDNPKYVKTALRKQGGKLFTGSGGAATSIDPWTTSVEVSVGTNTTLIATTAEINETESPGGVACTGGLGSPCFVSKITIPDYTGQLTITLRRDATTIPKSAKIANAVIYYDYQGDIAPEFPLQACTLAGPSLHVPCISSRTEYTKRTAPTPDDEGDWVIEIKALDNGRYLF